MAETGVKSVLTWTIALATIAFVLLLMIIIFGNLSGNSGIADSHNTVTVANETTGFINATGYTLSGYNTSWSSITITSAINSSNASTITPALYTVSASGVVTNTTAAVWEDPDAVWFAYTYVHTYTAPTATDYSNVITNYTTGAVNTAAQFPTVGTILGVALLILILLALLLYVIIKMSRATIGGGSKGSFTEGDFA